MGSPKGNPITESTYGGAVLVSRVSANEARLLRRSARRSGQTVSAFLRELVVHAVGTNRTRGRAA